MIIASEVRRRPAMVPLAVILTVSLILAGSVAAKIPLNFGKEKIRAEERQSIEVTLVGNSGFLIQSGGKKVLIDALHTEVSSAMRKRAERGLAPFDGADLILVTHTDFDHYYPRYALQNLNRFGMTRFLSTQEAGQLLERFGSTFETVRDRVHIAEPEEGKPLNLTLAGIEIKVFNLHHGRTKAITNLGFLLNLEGWKILHVGDTEATLEDLKSYGLDRQTVDLAFVPYWYFSSSKYKPALQEAIRARILFPMHFTVMDGGAEGYRKVMAGIRAEFPLAVILVDELEKWDSSSLR